MIRARSRVLSSQPIVSIWRRREQLPPPARPTADAIDALRLNQHAHIRIRFNCRCRISRIVIIISVVVILVVPIRPSSMLHPGLGRRGPERVLHIR